MNKNELTIKNSFLFLIEFVAEKRAVDMYKALDWSRSRYHQMRNRGSCPTESLESIRLAANLSRKRFYDAHSDFFENFKGTNGARGKKKRSV